MILGTAGHIDHGKTALVRALTGVDTDRLPEEKRRGITIDLGFARLALPSGAALGIVDVPGHEAFVRNMLAGATGIDLVLLVVAADAGVMPQTREHAAITELLGIRRGAVALTKSDLVDAEWLELVEEDVRGLLAGTPLADAAIIPVSSTTGAGLGELTAALDGLAADVPGRSADDLFRMPIDRVFTVRGTGTVVTGTVWSGGLSREEQVRIEPAGVTARVRGLQQHGGDSTTIRAGARAAVALAGVDRESLSRGDTLLTGAGWAAASILTVNLSVLADAASPIRPRQRVRVHVGTAEVLARIGLIAAPLEPGDSALAQLRLERPVVARAGDRFVIRSYSPVQTIGGGIVLEPCAPKRKRLSSEQADALHRLGTPADAVHALLALRGRAGAGLATLPVLTGLPPSQITAHDAVAVGDRLVATVHAQHCRELILRFLAQQHAARPLEDGPEREAVRRHAGQAGEHGIFEAVLHELATAGVLDIRGSSLALPQHEPSPGPGQQSMLDRLATVYAAAGLEAPQLTELPPELAALSELLLLHRVLERQGRLVRLGQARWADAAAVVECVARLRSELPAGQPLGVAELKAPLGLSRKHLIPLLEYLDRTGVTVRRGESRVLTPGSPPELSPTAGAG